MKPTLPACLFRQMTIRLVVLGLLFLSFGQAMNAQVLFNYTNKTSGEGTAASNMSATFLTRGMPNILQASDCMGDQGFGSHGWPTTNVFNVATFNANGWYVEFTLTPDPGYGLKITGFTSRSRRENLSGTADDGPIAMRYGHDNGNGTWTTINPGNPLSSNVCSSSGVNRTWTGFTEINSSTPVTFRIYGLSSGANFTGDLFLRDIIVNGEVCANAPSITPAPADFLVCAGETTFSSTYIMKDADTYAIDFDAAAEAEGFVDVTSTPLADAPGAISWTIPANATPGVYNAVVTVENECGFETNYNIEITVSALPDVVALLSADTICAGGSLTITFDDEANTGNTFHITADLVDDNGTTPINFPGVPNGAVLNLTEGIHFYGATGGTVTITNVVVEDETTGCTSEPDDVVLTVLPLPNVSVTMDDMDICDGGTVTLTFTDMGNTGHLFSITADLEDDNGTAVGAINYSNIPSGANDTYTEGLDFEGSSSNTVSLTNIVVKDETTGCEIELADLTITVNPYPVASFSVVSSPLCPGDLVEIYFNESAWLGGTEFTVGGDASPLVFGLDTLTFYEVIDGDHVDLTEGTDFTGDLTISQIIVTEPVSGCSAAAANVTVDVLPAPEFTFSAASENDGPLSGNNTSGPDTINLNFCAGDHLTLADYSDNGEVGYTVSFTTTGNVTYDGGLLPVSSGNSNVAPGSAATFFGQVYGGALGYGLDNGTSGAINQVFTPYLDNDNSGTFTAGDCEGKPMYLNYHIHAVPAVTVSPDPIALCHGSVGSATFSGNYNSGVTYSWTNDNTNIGVAASGTGDISFTAVNNTSAVVVANLTVTPSTDNCTGTPVNFTITVYPNPQATVTATVSGSGNPQTVSNYGTPDSITLDFCAGDSLTYSLYAGTPGIGFIEEIVDGTTNLLYGAAPIPVPRPQTNIAPGAVAGFFSGTYGTYNLASGTYGWMEETFTPYFDVNNDGDYDPGEDCLGEPFTLVYRVYAPITLTVTRNTPNAICSGDQVQYTISTSSTEDVTFDLVFEENTNGANPADLEDDNVFPAPTTYTINSANPYVFTATVNNAMGSFDRGRVWVRATNIGYADADVCTTADVNGQNTQVYPEPRLEEVSNILLSCDGNMFELDLALQGLPSINAAQAGNPVRVDWTVSGAGVIEDGAAGSAVIYDAAGVDVGDLQQVLTLVDPLQGAQTVTFIITPRASGPTNAFNGDDCIGDPIYVDVEVVPAGEPEIEGPSCTYVGASILLTGTANVQLPATVVSADWSTDGSGHATVDTSGLVTGVSVGTTTIFYTVVDDAGCVTTAEFEVNVIEEVIFTTVYTNGPVACGEDFVVSVEVSNFCDIGTVDHLFSWDPSIFQFVTFTTPALPGGTSNIVTLNSGMGQLTYTFGSTNPSGGTSLPDSTVIFTYTLRPIGPAGIYNVPVTNDLLDVYNSGFTQVPYDFTGVSIEVTNITIDLGPNPVVCPSDEFAFQTYSDVVGNPDYFVIDFDALAEAAGFPDTWEGPFNPNDGDIDIPLPNGLLAGSYHGTLVLSNSIYGCESDGYLITIIVDQQYPTASNPDPVNLECLNAIPAPDPSVVDDEDDNCPNIVVAYEPTLTDTTGTGCAGNPMIISRVYSVTDEAGNTTYVTQTITVEDDVPPTISTSGLAPWYPSGAAAVQAAIDRALFTRLDGNGCTPPVGITVQYNAMASDTSGCNGVIVLVVQDACGNITPAANATFYVTIDRTPPVASAGVIDECYEEDDTPTPPYGVFGFAVNAAILATSATDDCDNNLTYTAYTTGFDCDLFIHVVVTDDCGRADTVTYNTRVDSDAPSFTAPVAQIEAMLDGACFETEQEALDAAIEIAEQFAGDDCGSVDDLQFDAFANGGCPAEILVVVTDFCGNPSSLTFTGVHIDTEDPEVNPDPIYPTCFKTLQEAYNVLSVATNPSDNCTTTPELLANYDVNSFEVLPGEDDCTEYYIEFTFTDNCGNSVTYPYEGIVIDEIAPTAAPMTTLSYTCLDDVDAPDTGTVVADDNCGVQDIFWVSDVLPTTCPGTGTRTYRVTDCAGNSYDVVQIIEINDDVAPTWVTPANDLDRAPDCDDLSSIQAAMDLEPEAEDNCGEVTVVLESTTPIQTCAGGYIRTWRAYDDCGNSSTTVYVQTITIIDDVAPDWITTTQDIDTEVECSDVDGLDAALDQTPEAEDNCSGNITYTMADRYYTEYDECVNNYLGEWVTKWLAEDACGNVSDTFFHTVLVLDQTAPEWVTEPGDLNGTISCTDQVGYDYLNSLEPVAEDNCDQDLYYDKITGSFVPGGDCPGEGSFTNTWIVVDGCGNQTTAFTQVITVVDNTPPTFNPACQFMPLDLFTMPDGGPAANCDLGISLQVGDVLNYLSTWSVAGVSIPSLGGCIADDCSPIGGVSVEVVSIVEEVIDDYVVGINTYDCVRRITVSFQLTDACGNVQPELFVCVYNIIDNTPPDIICANGGGPSLPDDCYATVAAAEAAALEAVDACDNCTDVDDLTYTVNTVGTCSAEITVTVADCAGNTDSYTFYTRIDNAAPMMTATNIPLCYQDTSAALAAALAGTIISDNCDAYGDLNIITTISGICPATITVTAIDQCGNSRSIVYNGICVGMASDVDITEEADDLNVDCVDWQSDLSAWLANHGGAVAPGNDIQWSYLPLDPATMLQNSMANCTTHTKSVVVTFRATNGCGNYEETTATFSVTDLVPPTANQIANTNLSCSTQIPAPNLELVTGESDNCGGTVTVSLFGVSDNMAAGCPNSPRTIIHQYLVTDEYCNTAIINHTITVVDNVPPTFTAPANITINVNAGCIYDASTGVTGDVTDESDNCTPSGPGLQAYYTQVVNPGNDFQVKYVISRTWYLTDACGNSAIPKIQTITVKDVTAPVIAACPSNINVQGAPQVVEGIQYACTWTAGNSGTGIGYTDNCPDAVLSYHLDGDYLGVGDGVGSISGVVFLEGTTTVTYTVTDAVGNTATCSFTVTVNCLTISGRIIWEHDGTTGVKDATVNVTNVLPTPAFGGSDLSDTNGDYEVSIPVDGTYKVRPVKNINRLNGVTSADATAINNHVNLSAPITNPYKKVCADVNRSGIIQTQDATLITQCLLGNPTALNIFNVFWRFVPTDYVMPVSPHQNVPAFPDFKDVTLAGLDAVNIDFFGMKIGDVADPWANPQNIQSLPPLVWMVKDQQLVAGTEIELTFSASSFTDLSSYQFALDFDPTLMQFVGFEPLTALPMNLLDNFGAYNADMGELRHVWATGGSVDLAEGTAIFRAKFKVLQGGKKLSEVLRLDNSELECTAFNKDLIPTEVRLVFTETSSASNPQDPGKLELQLMQNRPNPFVDATTIGFILPEACEAHIRILDVSGRELTSYDRKYTAGYHELEFRMENASFYGVLYCELVTPQGKRTIKMMTAK